MAKRRLNQHQLRRIDSQQQERGKRASRPDAVKPGPLDHHPAGEELQGLIVCHYGQQLDVEALEGEHTGTVLRCHQRSNLPALVTGDRVIWQADGDTTGVIVAQMPRHSAMSRPNNRGELRAIAANIDCVVVVLAPLPEPFGNLIDRYLVAIERQQLRPLILLNKADLLTNADNQAAIIALLARYRRIGYETLSVSCRTGDGIDTVKSTLAQQTVVFVGQSGVGKSSLINMLRGISDENAEADAASVGSLSIGHEKGTHTTTATKLYHLPGSGDLVDSPGIREFGLWHIEPDQLMDGFIEFRPYAGQCRFRDCHHKSEPGCALRAAAARGDIDPLRLDSYHQILQSLTSAR